MISKYSKNTTSVVNSDLGLQMFSCSVGILLGKLYHLLGHIDRSHDEMAVSEVRLDLFFDKLQPSSSHVRFSNSFDLLDSIGLADVIESAEHFIHNLDDAALALFDDLIEVADITEQHTDLSCVIAQEVFLLHRTTGYFEVADTLDHKVWHEHVHSVS